MAAWPEAISQAAPWPFPAWVRGPDRRADGTVRPRHQAGGVRELVHVQAVRHDGRARSGATLGILVSPATTEDRGVRPGAASGGGAVVAVTLQVVGIAAVERGGPGPERAISPPRKAMVFQQDRAEPAVVVINMPSRPRPGRRAGLHPLWPGRRACSGSRCGDHRLDHVLRRQSWSNWDDGTVTPRPRPNREEVQRRQQGFRPWIRRARVCRTGEVLDRLGAARTRRAAGRAWSAGQLDATIQFRRCRSPAGPGLGQVHQLQLPVLHASPARRTRSAPQPEVASSVNDLDPVVGYKLAPEPGRTASSAPAHPSTVLALVLGGTGAGSGRTESRSPSLRRSCATRSTGPAARPHRRSPVVC